MPPFLSRALVVALMCVASACSSLGDAFRSRLVTDSAEVPAAIERAEREFAEGRAEIALRRAQDAREVRGLTPEQRDQLDLMIERFAVVRIDQLAQDPDNASELADLVEIGLPQQISVSAGLASARAYLQSGRPFKCYRVLRKVEERYPRHPGRAQAGEMLLEAGMTLADDPWSFLLWDTRDDGIEVLEFLVLTYPSERRCDEAYAKLAQMYEDDKLYALAIQRHEELLFGHADSPLAPISQARIPHLRLLGHESPEYDRTELLRARRELEVWISTHVGDPNEAAARLDYADCLQRLVRSDMGIARFYRRIDSPWGARYHSERALRVALETGDERLIADARTLLSKIPVAAAASKPIGDEAFSADATLLRTTVEEQGLRDPVLPDPNQPPGSKP